jgi:hypothetical protein
VVLVLTTWQHYLHGNVVHIYTDHKGLMYIFTQSDLNMRQQRWLELIKEYELEVHYHLGKGNVVADVLSHKAHCNYLRVVRLTGEESMSHPVLRPNQMLIVCVPRNQVYTYTIQKMGTE